MKVVSIVGMAGSGKSEVARVFERAGFARIRFGDITDEEVRRRGLDLNEKNERLVRQQLREEHGMAAYAKLSLPKIDRILESGSAVVDGLYSWEEYILMKKCHDWYLLNRVENKINVAKVLEILNHEETLALYKMIRRFQINQYNQDQQKHDNGSNDIIQYPYARNEPSPRTPRSVVSMEILPDVED